MKKVLVFILMLVAFAACSKDDNSGNDVIKKATVKGAQIIYRGSAGTRAVSGDFTGFMTIDEQGNVKPIRFVTEKGDTLDMYISEVHNLNDEYLMLKGGFQIGEMSYEALLVNKNTEAIYGMGIDFFFWPDTEYPGFEDRNNNLYFGDNQMLYRFDVSDSDNVTVEPYLPDNIDLLSDYIVNENGFCSYFSDFHNIKCPGGRLYNLKELMPNGEDFYVFKGFNQHFYVCEELYSFSSSVIYRVDEIGNNELKAVRLTDAECTNVKSWMNSKRKTHILSSWWNALYEFNEETAEIRNIASVPEWNEAYLTSESLWFMNDTELYQLDLEDYSLKKIDLIRCGYEIKRGNISSSSNGPGLSFSGIRYADGQNVVGTINEDGTVTAFEKTKTSNEIITLIRLN